MKKFLYILILAVLLLPSCTKKEGRKQDSSLFILHSSLKCTPVKDQGKVQACWIYAYLACLETERIENFDDSMNLSPMWLVRASLKQQARDRYLSQGAFPISTRGIGPDADRLLRRYGMVQWASFCPDDVNGKVLERDITKKVEVAIRNKKGLAWIDSEIEGALPKLPHNLIREAAPSIEGRAGREAIGFYLYGMHYTPQQFGESLLYQVHFTWLTSYTHHPYGQSFVIEIPDNYNRNEIMNVPLEQMYNQVVKALKAHHPVYWEGQMGPVHGSKFIVHSSELTELRQKAFERFETTDQHAMAIVGLTKDGFICKNSWGKDWGMNGYCVMSKKAFLVNTILVGIVGND